MENLSEKQNLLIVAFIITYVNSLCLFEDFCEDFDIILNDKILPSNPIESNRYSYIQNINLFLFNCVYSLQDHIILKLYNQIFRYWAAAGPNAILNFIPVLNQLLYQWRSNSFFDVFIHSSLFSGILKAAQTNFFLFNFVNCCVHINPSDSFQSDMLVWIAPYFLNNDLRNEASTFIYEALKVAGDKKDLQNNVLIVIGNIVTNLVSSDNTEAIIVLLDVVTHCFPGLQLSLIQNAFQTSIFDNMAKIAITSDQYFRKFLFFLTKMGTDYLEFIEFFASRQSVRSILKQYKPKEIPIFYLFRFAFCSQITKDFKCQYIRNWTAIELLLALLMKVNDQEIEIVKYLSELSSNNGNLIELDRAGLPEFILKRLPIIQHQTELREMYLQLFSKITASIFNNTTFYRTIELLKIPDYEYSTEILDILNNHLDYRNNNIIESPTSFFRFDSPNGCGLFDSSVKLPGNFSVCFWIRLNDIFSDHESPLLYIDFGKNHMCVEFEGNYLYFVDKRDKKQQIDYKFNQGEWYFTTLVFSKSLVSSKLTLFVNGKEESSVDMSATFSINVLSSDCKLSICSIDGSTKSESLICDISSIFVFGTKDTTLMTKNLRASNIPKSLYDSLICCYNPSNAHGSQCFNVNSSKVSVPYKGRAIPYVSNIYDVVQTVGAVQNFLPLFNRLSSDYEGPKIQTEKGSDYLRILLSIFAKMVKICEPMFVSTRFFELLAAFLYFCEEKYLTVPVITELSELFNSVKSINLKAQMIISIFLNYSFAVKLQISAFATLYDNILPILVNEWLNKEFDFRIDSLTYSTIQYFCTPSEISDFSWKFLKRLYLIDPSQENIDSLIMSLLLFKSDFVTEKILDILLDLIAEHTAVLFRKYSYVSPFIVVMGENSPEAAILALKCIVSLHEFSDFNLENALYQVITVIHKMEYFDVFTQTVFDIFMSERKIINNPIFFPLVIHSIMLSSEEKQKNLISILYESITKYTEAAAAITDFHSWPSLLIAAIRVIYDPNTEVEMFSLPFTCLFEIEFKEGRINKIADFFDYLDLLASKYKHNYRSLKRRILMSILHSSTISSEQLVALFPIAFEFMVFDFTVLSIEENCQLSFKIIPIDTVKIDEIDLELASTLVFAALNENVKIKICDVYEIHIAPAAAFIALNFFKVGSDKNALFVNEMTKHFPSYDDETRNLCNSMLIQSFVTGKESDLFKNTWFSSIFQLSEKIIEAREARVNSIMSYLNEGKIEILGLDESQPIAKRLIAVTDPESFAKFFVENDLYIKEQQINFESEKKILSKLKETFLRDIAKVPGPWTQIDADRKFKALNRISKRGQRILMVINNKFHDHHEAAKNRDCQNELQAAPEIFHYKPIRQLPFISESRYFSSKVTLRSIARQYVGNLCVSDQFITFVSENKSTCIFWNRTEFILNRRVANIDNSCELFTLSGRSYFFIFSKGERKRFYNYLSHLNIPLRDTKVGDKFDFFNSLRRVCHSIFQNKSSESLVNKLNLVQLWQNRKINTFAYIYYLNLLSGRSYNDLKQYPIFPYLIKECDSQSIDFEDPSIFRDLAIPTAFICQHQRDIPPGINLFNQLPSSEFLTTWGMIRVEPFTSLQISCQGNKFLESSRQFYSVKGVWNNMQQSILANESLPEYFTFPYVYINENHFDLGVRPSDQITVDDVILPNWSKNAFIYASVNRIAMECDIVSKSIHQWIDLFFGIKRRFYDGAKLYPDFSYPEMNEEKKKKEKNNISIENLTLVENFEVQFTEEERIQNCEEFGTMPLELFTEPHAERGSCPNSILIDSPSQPTNVINKMSKYNKICRISTASPVNHIKKNVIQCDESKLYTIKNDELVETPLPIVCGELLCVSRLFNIAVFGTRTDNFLTVFNLNTKEIKTEFHIHSIITCATITGSRYLVTGGSDCSIRVWDLSDYKLVKSSGYHSDYITSIGCCCENGLLVSIDKFNTIVYETLFDNVFINSIKLEKLDENDTFIPQICVFRSGIVCVSQKNRVIYFDSHGKEISHYTLHGDFIEMHKYVDFDTREILIVGYESKCIDLIDMTTFTPFARIETYHFHFYPLKNSKALLVSSHDELNVYSFANFIPPVISNFGNDEISPIVVLRHYEA